MKVRLIAGSMLAALAMASSGRAAVGYQINVASESLLSSSTATSGQVDVYLTTSAPPVYLSGYNVDVSLTSTDPSVLLTGAVQSSATHPALFGEPPSTVLDTDTSDVLVADSPVTGPASDEATSGIGLFAIDFTIPADFVGSFTIAPQDDVMTDLFDPDASNASINGFNAGTITVSAVPEPASITMLGGASLLLLRRRRSAASI